MMDGGKAVVKRNVNEELFSATSQFQGPWEGYYFGCGDRGVGYYVDDLSNRKKRRKKDGFAEIRGGEELLDMVEREAGVSGGRDMDAKGLKRLLQNLEKRFNVNVEQRVKYSGEPEKFMESEVELDEAVCALNAVTASGNLYHLLANPSIIQIFLALVQHENGDIAADTIQLLSELTEADAVESFEEEAGGLIDALLEGGLVRVLVQTLEKLDESVKEEASAVYNALSVLENCIDVRSECASGVAGTAGVMEWLCNRLSPKAEVDSNKQYSSEVLAVLLQSAGVDARVKFVELGGVDTTLLSIAPFRSNPMQTPEEEEFVENAFDVLCSVLMEDCAKLSFLENEGIELMILMIKGRTAIRTAAIKCLDFATTRFNKACERGVKKGILAVIFGVFMGKLKVNKGDKKMNKKHMEANRQEEEIRCVSIVNNLFVGLVDDKEGRARLIGKFIESEYEKCDRLIEILVEYASKVAVEEERITRVFGQGGEVDEDEILLARMDAGLFTLQQCALIIAELWASKDHGLRKRILLLLHQHEYTLGLIRTLVAEYIKSLGPLEEATSNGLHNPQAHITRVTQCLEMLVNQ